MLRRHAIVITSIAILHASMMLIESEIVDRLANEFMPTAFRVFVLAFVGDMRLHFLVKMDQENGFFIVEGQ